MKSLIELVWEGIAKLRDYSGHHASHYDSECRRYAYYQITNPELFARKSRKVKFRLWIGEAIHDKRLLPEDPGFLFDKSIKYNDCSFTPDEYYKGILLEKKTMKGWSKLPSYLRKPKTEHIIRCENYRMALELNHYPVEVVGLLYIDYTEEKIALFSTEDETLKLRPTSEAKQNFDLLNADMHMSVSKKLPPPRTITWLCDFCSAYTKCFGEDTNV